MNTSVIKDVKTYKAEDVAKCLIKVANDKTGLGVDPESNTVVSEGITNLKLQKMLFFADAVSLALNDKPLIEEDFEAWSLGPVIKKIYDKYKENNRAPIQANDSLECDQDLESFIVEVWKTFGKYSASELVHLSHQPNSPWEKSFSKGQNTIIPKEEIKTYYKQFFQLANG